MAAKLRNQMILHRYMYSENISNRWSQYLGLKRETWNTLTGYLEVNRV